MTIMKYCIKKVIINAIKVIKFLLWVNFYVIALKKDLKERIEDLESRLTNSVTVLKGRKPIEDPQSLMTQLEDSSKQLNDICCRIKMANAMAKNDKGLTLVEHLKSRSWTLQKRYDKWLRDCLRQLEDLQGDTLKDNGVCQVHSYVSQEDSEL